MAQYNAVEGVCILFIVLSISLQKTQSRFQSGYELKAAVSQHMTQTEKDASGKVTQEFN